VAQLNEVKENAITSVIYLGAKAIAVAKGLLLASKGRFGPVWVRFARSVIGPEKGAMTNNYPS